MSKELSKVIKSIEIKEAVQKIKKNVEKAKRGVKSVETYQQDNSELYGQER